MKEARLPFQIFALLLQVWFIIETIKMLLYKSGEEGWFALLFTLLIVIACEVVSFVDIILFVISKHNLYSFINLALYVVNAVLFMTVIYYDSVGTVIGLSLYAVIFILRIINLVQNFMDIVKER